MLQRNSVARGGVLEDALEDTFWNPWPWPRRSSPWPWPRSLKSSKIGLSSARGQHYFLNNWNFVGKRQKPRGKFTNTFFVFVYWSIDAAKGGAGGPPPIEILPMTKMWQKVYCFFSFSFFLAFFAYNSNYNNKIEDQRPRAPLNSIFICQFKRITRKKWRVFVLKVAISGRLVAFLWT